MSICTDVDTLWNDVCRALESGLNEQAIKSFFEPVVSSEKSLDDVIHERLERVPMLVENRNEAWTKAILEQYKKSGILSVVYLLTQAIQNNDDNTIDGLLGRMKEAYEKLVKNLEEITPVQKKANEYGEYMESLKVKNDGEPFIVRVTANPVIEMLKLRGQARIFKCPVRRALRYGSDYIEFNSIAERYTKGKAWAVRQYVDKLMLFAEAYETIKKAQAEHKGRNIIITPRKTIYRDPIRAVVIVNKGSISIEDGFKNSEPVEYTGTIAEIAKAFFCDMSDEKLWTYSAIFVPTHNVSLGALSIDARLKHRNSIMKGNGKYYDCPVHIELRRM